MNNERTERGTAIDLTEEEALALLSMCALSIKSLDEEARAALDKLTAYCKHLHSSYIQAEA